MNQRRIADGGMERINQRRYARQVLGLNDSQLLQIKQKVGPIIRGLS